MEVCMWREISEKPQMKNAVKVVVTVIAVISALNALSDFPVTLAKHKHILLIVLEVIVGLIILIACYALLYMSIQTALFFGSLLVMSLWHLIFRHGAPKTKMNTSTEMKLFLTIQALSLVLTIFISIATHGHIMSVFTYWSDKREKDEYNKMMLQERQNCLSNPHNTSDIAKRFCYEETEPRR
jgi:hypothetical protein